MKKNNGRDFPETGKWTQWHRSVISSKLDHFAFKKPNESVTGPASLPALYSSGGPPCPPYYLYESEIVLDLTRDRDFHPERGARLYLAYREPPSEDRILRNKLT